MTEIYNFAELSKNDKYIIAGMVSAYSHPLTHREDGEQGQALDPVSLEEIMASELALVGFVEDAFAGYVRAKAKTVDERNGRIVRQVGSLVVMPNFRDNGVATSLVSGITEAVTADQNTPYAFCAPSSQSVFKRVGYHEALPGELPVELVSRRGNQAMVL